MTIHHETRAANVAGRIAQGLNLATDTTFYTNVGPVVQKVNGDEIGTVVSHHETGVSEMVFASAQPNQTYSFVMDFLHLANRDLKACAMARQEEEELSCRQVWIDKAHEPEFEAEFLDALACFPGPDSTFRDYRAAQYVLETTHGLTYKHGVWIRRN